MEQSCDKKRVSDICLCGGKGQNLAKLHLSKGQVFKANSDTKIRDPFFRRKQNESSHLKFCSCSSSTSLGSRLVVSFRIYNFFLNFEFFFHLILFIFFLLSNQRLFLSVHLVYILSTHINIADSDQNVTEFLCYFA